MKVAFFSSKPYDEKSMAAANHAAHHVAMVMTFDRQTQRAYQRVREGNFALDGLLGRDLNGETVGVVGTGRIGRIFAKIMQRFGCRVLAYDVFQHPDCIASGVEY